MRSEALLVAQAGLVGAATGVAVSGFKLGIDALEQASYGAYVRDAFLALPAGWSDDAAALGSHQADHGTMRPADVTCLDKTQAALGKRLILVCRPLAPSRLSRPVSMRTALRLAPLRGRWHATTAVNAPVRAPSMAGLATGPCTARRRDTCPRRHWRCVWWL